MIGIRDHRPGDSQEEQSKCGGNPQRSSDPPPRPVDVAGELEDEEDEEENASESHAIRLTVTRVLCSHDILSKRKRPGLRHPGLLMDELDLAEPIRSEQAIHLDLAGVALVRDDILCLIAVDSRDNEGAVAPLIQVIEVVTDVD